MPLCWIWWENDGICHGPCELQIILWQGDVGVEVEHRRLSKNFRQLSNFRYQLSNVQRHSKSAINGILWSTELQLFGIPSDPCGRSRFTSDDFRAHFSFLATCSAFQHISTFYVFYDSFTPGDLCCAICITIIWVKFRSS